MASQETSSGYGTSEERSQRSRLERTPISHVPQSRYCPECGCCLEAISREMMDLKEENRRLRRKVTRESELAKQEHYCCIDLQQMLDKTEGRYKAELNRLREELRDSQADLDNFDSENKSLQRRLQASQVENDGLQVKLVHIQKKAKQLDEAVQQLRNSHTELRKTSFRAFCKVRPSLLDLHKVILNHIPNNGENTQMWLEFFTALNMQHKDMPPLLSEHDARWNVHIVLDAWLKGVGSEPKTWGTLLNAMRERGTPFLRDLADAAEEVYLRKLASLHLPFDVCCVCWRDCSLATAAECSEAPV